MKQIIIFVLALVFFVGGLVYVNIVVFNPASQAEQDYVALDSVTATIKDPMADSDGDGLKNWEEDLYGSSKKNVDSDGDGMGDGEEIAQGTDPTIYGTVPRYVDVVLEDTNVYEFERTSNPTSIDDLMRLVNKVEPAGDAPSLDLTPGDLSYKRCLNGLGTILQNSLVTGINDAATINNYITNQTTNSDPIEQIRQAAQVANVSLLRLSLDGCTDLTLSVQSFSQAYSTQVLALDQVLFTTASTTEHYTAWVTYAEAVHVWNATAVEVGNLVEQKGITFTASEPGYIFSQEF